MFHPALLSGCFCLLVASGLAAVPPNIVAEGVPAVTPALTAELAPYLNLGGASFRGWHSTRRAALVTTRIGDASHLHLMDAPLAKRAALTGGIEPVKGGLMQPGGTLLMYSSDVGGDENHQLFLKDTADLKAPPRLLTDGKSRNIEACWSPDGQRIAFSTNRRNGKDSDIVIKEVTAPFADRVVHTGTSPGWGPLEWSPDGKLLLLRQSMSLAGSRLWTMDVATAQKTQITPKTGRTYFTQASFGEGGRAVYALANLDSDFLTPTRIDVATAELRKLAGGPAWDGEELVVSGDGKRLAVTFNVEGFSELRCWDLATGQLLPAPKLKAGVLSNLQFRPGSHEVGFSLNSEDSPSDAWSADLDSAAVTRWTSRASKPKLEIPSPEPVISRTLSFDGVSIPSLIYHPDPRKFPGKRPVLMVFHGGPEGQSRPGYRGGFHFYLNELGVALVYPNVRGSTGYGRKYLALDDGVKREGAIRDIGAVLDWIVQSDRLDATRVASYGGSYGGFMSLACLVNYPERFRCGVDNVGIANFATFLRDTSDYRRNSRRMEYGDERKPEIKAFLDRISPANHADRIRAPLLIVQGKNDPRVPFTEAEQMRDAVKGQGGTVWYVLAKDEGHGFAKKVNADYQFATTILFLRTHLLN
ncbi:MAG: peptidase S9, prolyl oligopeptidase [Opitutia bacterium]|nr:S9 family peptidase [Opitutales bacterium]PHX79566.1 MAG: peptidase S9, prolyl oligopeptidase [Opitutae bacterium]